MRVLGLDPGLRHTGWGIIDVDGNRLAHVADGIAHAAADQPLAMRLVALFRQIGAVLERFRPDEAAVEETFVNKNPSSTLKLGVARGVVLLAPAERGLPVAEYSANLIKKSIVGAGHAEKAQVRDDGPADPAVRPRDRYGRRRRCARRRDLPRPPRSDPPRLGRPPVIAKLAGIVDQIGEDGAVVDVGGVGYLAFCSTRTIGRLPRAGAPVRLLIETHVREDHIHLYGFIDAAERDWFRLLTTVQGVGARLALAVLSAVTPEELSLAIFAQDRTVPARAEGVGPRLAARIVNELKDKVSGLGAAASLAAAGAAAGSAGDGPAAEAISALVNLGYRRVEAFGAVAAVAQRLGPAAADRRADPRRPPGAGPRRAARSGGLSDGASRIVDPAQSERDMPEGSLRPLVLAEFVGQRQLRDNLRIFIDAAKARSEALDHVLLFGPPGLGKTTLAQIVAREMGVGFRATSGPVIQRAGDLAALLTNLEPRDVLFIDEIHRLAPPVEEILYPAMEDFQLDLIIGEGPGARSIRIDLPPFTLVGATTRSGLITRPLRERFGIPLRLLVL